MSRFTSPYHINKPSAQQLASTALAITNPNTVNPPYADELGSSANASGNPHDLSFSALPSFAALSETPTRMPSRTTTSVLGYNPSGRERPRQRASRWLILILPPSFITQSQGALGHTLSSGPSSRLSQGLLLPLYPTVSRSVLQPSKCLRFDRNPSDVCAAGRDRARIQFPEHLRDLPVYARQ